jgi:hypothetical protein
MPRTAASATHSRRRRQSPAGCPRSRLNDSPARTSSPPNGEAPNFNSRCGLALIHHPAYIDLVTCRTGCNPLADRLDLASRQLERTRSARYHAYRAIPHSGASSAKHLVASPFLPGRQLRVRQTVGRIRDCNAVRRAEHEQLVAVLCSPVCPAWHGLTDMRGRSQPGTAVCSSIARGLDLHRPSGPRRP